MLHVPDQLIGPVQKIEGTVRRHIDRDRAEIRIIRFHQIFQRLAFQAGARFGHFHSKDALEANNVAVQKISLELIRKMPAGNHAGSRTGTRGALPEFLHFRVFGGVVQVAAEGRAEIVVVAGRIGDDVVAPVVEHASVRIGKAVGNVALEFVCARLEPVDASVNVAHGSPRGLDLGAVKNAVAEISRAAGVQHH